MGVKPNELEEFELKVLNLGSDREASIIFRDEDSGMSIARVDKAIKPDWTEWELEGYYILPEPSKSYWSLNRAHLALLEKKS